MTIGSPTLQPRTLSDVLVPRRSGQQHAAVRDLVLIVSFSLFVALCARVQIRLGFTPVPITAQTLGVLLSGALLGSRRGALALLLYLAEGALGLPVFAGGGGIAWLVGPTGGYLLATPVAAYLTGMLAERGWDRRVPTAALTFSAGNAIFYALGVPWLGLYKGILFNIPLLWAGVYPFLPGDALKILVAMLVLPSAWRLTSRWRS